MNDYAVSVQINVTVGVRAEDERDALAQVSTDDNYWMEPVTQGDGKVQIGPVCLTEEDV